MSGGLDLIIVGVAGENLDHIASAEKLRSLFSKSDESYVDDFYALIDDPTAKNPRMFYLAGEHLLGFQAGVGLGYVIFGGNNNAPPKRISPSVFERIPELTGLFLTETRRLGLNVSEGEVGVYALNVYDT